MKNYLFLLSVCLLAFSSCKKDEVVPEDPKPEPRLIFKFKFDSSQVRLDNVGNPSTLPSNHRAQTPKFNKMSAHYIELAQNDNIAVGGGVKLYKATETTAGGATAIDFSKSFFAGNNEEFYSVPISQVAAGTYKWLRVSLAYQNYDIVYKNSAIPGGFGTGTIASFIGFRTYIGNYTIKTQSQTVYANKDQGFWGFETSVLGTTYTSSGQAPAGSTTVVNPLFATSPIPAGSCLVTGKFVNSGGSEQNLVITGSETSDVVITVSLSTNNSFEWVEHGGDNNFEPAASNPANNDTVTDMGIRGMIPFLPN